MPKSTSSTVSLRVRYVGAGPVFWDGGPDAFGLQDVENGLLPGAQAHEGGIDFHFTLEARTAKGGGPVLAGVYAHGRPGERFLYLSWRQRAGNYAQRLKLPLTNVTWDDIETSLRLNAPISCTLVDDKPRATSTGANIGGTRSVQWTVSKDLGS